MQWLMLIGAWASLACAAGCMTVQRPPNGSGVVSPGLGSGLGAGGIVVSAEPRATVRWPERFGPACGSEDGGTGSARKGVVVPMDGHVRRPFRGQRTLQIDLMIADAKQDVNALWAYAGRKSATTIFGEYYLLPDRRPDEMVRRRLAAGASRLFKFISGEEATWIDTSADPDAMKAGLLLQRTWFALYDPVRTDAEGHARGIVLIVPGMFGLPETVIDRLTTSLRRRGWAVVRMLAHPSRVLEKAEHLIATDGEPAELELSATAAAHELTNRAAEYAYAARAALEYVAAERPDLPVRPRVAVGISGGAMVLPTVVALEPDAYDAAVLVAGGADFFAITDQSNLSDGVDAVRITWLGGTPTRDAREAFSRLYLERAALDSYHTAAALRGTPVLMLHSSSDRGVPAAQGDLLWERLGRPERWVWSWPVGHNLLMILLPKTYDRIGQWMERAVRKPEPSGVEAVHQ